MKTTRKYIAQKMIAQNKTYLVQLQNIRYSALKPLKNRFMRLEKMLKEYILSHINLNDANDSNNLNNSND